MNSPATTYGLSVLCGMGISPCAARRALEAVGRDTDAILAYSASQPRDDMGRFAGSGPSGGASGQSQRWKRSQPTLRKRLHAMHTPFYSGVRQSVGDRVAQMVAGRKLAHATWVDKRTGTKYDFRPKGGFRLSTLVPRDVPGEITKTTRTGKQSTLPGPKYNILRNNCQDANKWLHKYAPKFKQATMNKPRTSTRTPSAMTTGATQ